MRNKRRTRAIIFITLFLISFFSYYNVKTTYINKNNQSLLIDDGNEESILGKWLKRKDRLTLLFEDKNNIFINRPILNREAFLTFDDGPSRNNTIKILSILKNNSIKATFFIVGKQALENPDIIKQLDKEGMCIAAHSQCHEYSIYKSEDSFMKDLNECFSVLKNIMDKEPIKIIRFPGGSHNKLSRTNEMIKIKKLVLDNGINYVDWNVSSADAAAAKVPSEKIKENVIKQCKKINLAIILMHDAGCKTTTAEALPEVIDSLKKSGFEFRTFNDLSVEEKNEMIKKGILDK